MTISEPAVHANQIRKRLELTGILQGIGFRPTVYRLAKLCNLTGWVINTTSGVVVEIEGKPEDCDHFIEKLPHEIPFPGRIDECFVHSISGQNDIDFQIRSSVQGQKSTTPIPPDTATCPECVRELFDPSNCRYLFPFITCTVCGPRFTVVRSFPYDRHRTSMVDFTMCPRCESEYKNPLDRRFHSQTNSCPDCGPKLNLIDADGSIFPGDPIANAIALLTAGKIVALKGIGGFHLACDALNEDAVQLLRQRKGRAEKPFAVMVSGKNVVPKYCNITEVEENLLTSAVSPIVLLEKREFETANSVAPGVGCLGVMLPYTPIHHLLFNHPEVPTGQRPEMLVMTSGNMSEEPIVKDNSEALERLAGLADAFLVHDRDIVLRADDSIYRVINDTPVVLRRSRGLVPDHFSLSSSEGDTILAAGGDLKNALAVITTDRAVLGPHVGDLASPVGQEYFRQSIKVLTGYLEVDPKLTVADPHPEYYSNQLALELGNPVTHVYHHHAHAAALITEHRCETPLITAVFDGTGFGPDGKIWGGEFLLADMDQFVRLGHFTEYQLPGGEAAIKLPVRILAGFLCENGDIPDKYHALFDDYRKKTKLWLEAMNRNINSPLTTSLGRIFDAAAAALGFRRNTTFEGQAAMWLEAMAKANCGDIYPLEPEFSEPLYIDSKRLIRLLCEDVISGKDIRIVSARFHNTVAKVTAEALQFLAKTHKASVVGLSGGCFQNKILTEKTLSYLKNVGLKTLVHAKIPPNDGGLAIGQAVVARNRNLKGKQ